MKALSTLLVVILFAAIGSAQQITGTWKTIDDNTGEAKSTVKIFEEDGKIFGKIVGIENPADRDKTCIYCEGEDKDAPLIGLTIIKDLEKEDDRYAGGTIFDPEKGKEYKAKIWLEPGSPDTLNVRGYIAFLFITQQWERVK